MFLFFGVCTRWAVVTVWALRWAVRVGGFFCSIIILSNRQNPPPPLLGKETLASAMASPVAQLGYPNPSSDLSDPALGPEHGSPVSEFEGSWFFDASFCPLHNVSFLCRAPRNHLGAAHIKVSVFLVSDDDDHHLLAMKFAYPAVEEEDPIDYEMTCPGEISVQVI